MSEELKPTQDVLVAEAKAEGQKLEWGPEQGGMSWFKANDLKSELKVREAYVTRNRYSTGILVNYDGTFTPSQDATQMNGGDVIFVRDIA
ncbi:MAG: hypothetical protein NTU76_03115 [Candidatus Taylorbacteria bacterium]|nr:hypothetical protein [Candidatus Taylorbacteria bacterium]